MMTEGLQAATVLLAVYGLRTWRQQLVGKRRFEVAEQAVLAANRVKEGLASIRTDASMSGEADDRKPGDGETSQQRRMLDRYFIPLKRSQDANEHFAELAKCRLLCATHFGPQTKAPFEKLFAARNRVIAGAQTLTGLVMQVGHPDNDPQQHFPSLHKMVWGLGDANDADAVAIQEAVTEIENFCRPHLSPPDDLAWLKALWHRLD